MLFVEKSYRGRFMNRFLRIRIDAGRLRLHLQSEDRRALSAVDIHYQLLDAGFMPSGDTWIVREADLGYLRPEEVISVEVVGDWGVA